MKDAAPDPALARDVFAEKGQICHETNTLRSTNVTFKCCEPDKRRRHRTYLVSVDETSLCNYEVVVCSPSLCTQPEPQKRNASASELLKALDGTCLQRHEGWWSFELCYGTHARQFHVETVEASDGRKKAKVAAEFSLGDRMEKRRKPSSASDVVVVEGDEPRVEVTYEGGTACDVDVEGDGVIRKRSTTARSFVEKRTPRHRGGPDVPLLIQGDHARALRPLLLSKMNRRDPYLRPHTLSRREKKKRGRRRTTTMRMMTRTRMKKMRTTRTPAVRGPPA